MKHKRSSRRSVDLQRLFQIFFILGLFGIGAYGYVSFSVSHSAMLAAAGGGGKCEPAYQKCMKQDVPKKVKTPARCEQDFQDCVLGQCKEKKKVAGGETCNKAPDCQLHCTESATGKGAIIACCKGKAEHVNKCKDEVDGKCNPKLTKTGDPKTDKQGGEPKMPELPKPPGGGSGGGGGGQPPQDPCKTQTQSGSAAPERSACPGQTPSTLSSILGAFGLGDPVPSGGQSENRNALDSLSDLANAQEETTGTSNETSNALSVSYQPTAQEVAYLANSTQEQKAAPNPSTANTGSQIVSTGFTNAQSQLSSSDRTLLGNVTERLTGALNWLRTWFK